LLHSLGCRRSRTQLDRRTCAKASELLRIRHQSAAQPTLAQRDMYHMIAAKNRAHLRPSQNGHDREAASERAHFAAPALGSVECLDQQCNLSGADGLADLLKPGNGDARPPPEANRIAAALRQQRLDAIR
jgi:hypothetical protein